MPRNYLKLFCCLGLFCNGYSFSVVTTGTSASSRFTRAIYSCSRHLLRAVRRPSEEDRLLKDWVSSAQSVKYLERVTLPEVLSEIPVWVVPYNPDHIKRLQPLLEKTVGIVFAPGYYHDQTKNKKRRIAHAKIRVGNLIFSFPMPDEITLEAAPQDILTGIEGKSNYPLWFETIYRVSDLQRENLLTYLIARYEKNITFNHLPVIFNHTTGGGTSRDDSLLMKELNEPHYTVNESCYGFSMSPWRQPWRDQYNLSGLSSEMGFHFGDPAGPFKWQDAALARMKSNPLGMLVFSQQFTEKSLEDRKWVEEELENFYRWTGANGLVRDKNGKLEIDWQ